MKKITNIGFIVGAVLVIGSLVTGFLARKIWVPFTDITMVFLGIVVSILALLFWHSKDTPLSHDFAWIGIGTGMLLYSIGTIFRLIKAGPEGISTNIFIVTDYLILAAYALITSGYYFFMSRAGNIIDEVDKLKIIWGAGIFIILVFDLYLAIQATEIFGKTTGGLLVNLYYVSLDLIMFLIGITYLFAFSNGKISLFFRVILLAIILWALSDIIFVLRGSYTKQVSFILTFVKIISIFALLFSEKFYAKLFTP